MLASNEDLVQSWQTSQSDLLLLEGLPLVAGCLNVESPSKQGVHALLIVTAAHFLTRAEITPRKPCIDRQNKASQGCNRCPPQHRLLLLLFHAHAARLAHAAALPNEHPAAIQGQWG